jgi:hypothetical protein
VSRKQNQATRLRAIASRWRQRRLVELCFFDTFGFQIADNAVQSSYLLAHVEQTCGIMLYLSPGAVWA